MRPASQDSFRFRKRSRAKAGLFGSEALLAQISLACAVHSPPDSGYHVGVLARMG
jgi:hypothetical protein